MENTTLNALRHHVTGAIERGEGVSIVEKPDLIGLLRVFVATRPGFEFGNYGDVSAYRSDVRRVARQLNDAREMLRFCELRNISPDLSAFSGRLTLENGKIYYCAGQYYCTEYRAAVCACCSSAIWAWFRECGYSTGDEIRKAARNEFGRGIANRWFN